MMPDRKKQFTLTELMLVVAVLAIFAGLQLPLWSNVREKADAASCLEQHKQIGVAQALYSGDQAGWLVPAMGAGPVHSDSWVSLLSGVCLDGAPRGSANYGVVFYGTTLEKNATRGTFACDRETVPFGWPGKGHYYYTHIGANVYLLGNGSDPGTGPRLWRKTTAVRHPADAIVAGDSKLSNSYALTGAYEFAYRHGATDSRSVAAGNIYKSPVPPGGANLIYADGHAAARTFAELCAVKNPEMKDPVTAALQNGFDRKAGVLK